MLFLREFKKQIGFNGLIYKRYILFLAMYKTYVYN